MILGFRANINNDTHRIFLTRLSNAGIKLSGIQSEEADHYTFLIKNVSDLKHAEGIAKMMSKTYDDLPLNYEYENL